SLRPESSRILFDPFARALAGRNPLLHLVRFARFVVPALRHAIDQLQTAHCVRHRSIDELILRSVEHDGFEQVVVLGAGYDMRPHRLSDRLGQTRWFEMDLPLMAERKQRLVRGLVEADRVTYAPIDLRCDSLARRLAATSFDAGRPTCFVLEGLVHYL